MIDRLLAQPVTAPLKAMLTGVELLLAKGQVGAWLLHGRAVSCVPSSQHVLLAADILMLCCPLLTCPLQLWEETAARHVSLAPQLAPLSALATRWRRLELAAWRGLLDRTRQRAAEVAHQVRWLGDAGWVAGSLPCLSHLDACLCIPPLLHALSTPSTACMPDYAPHTPLALHLPPQAWFHLYRILLTADDLAPAEVAPTVEQFMLSAPLGEFAARLGLLDAFHRQLTALAAASDGMGGGAEAAERRQRWRALAALLSNVVRYYRQFEPAVQLQISAGMAELEKALQVSHGGRWVWTQSFQTERGREERRLFCRHVLVSVTAALTCVMTPLCRVCPPSAGLCGAGKVGGPRLLCSQVGPFTATLLLVLSGNAVHGHLNHGYTFSLNLTNLAWRHASCRVSNEKAQRQLHRLTRRAVQLLREPSTATLALAAKQMGFGDLQREGQADAAPAGTAATPVGKKRLGKKAAAAAAAAAEAAAQADHALAEPETAAVAMAAARSTAAQQLSTLPGWAPAGKQQAAAGAPPLPMLEGSKYAAQLPRLTRRFAEVAGAVVASEAAAAGAASTDDLASEAAGRALELRGDVAKGAKARKKKALTGGWAAAA